MAELKYQSWGCSDHQCQWINLPTTKVPNPSLAPTWSSASENQTHRPVLQWQHSHYPGTDHHINQTRLLWAWAHWRHWLLILSRCCQLWDNNLLVLLRPFQWRTRFQLYMVLPFAISRNHPRNDQQQMATEMGQQLETMGLDNNSDFEDHNRTASHTSRDVSQDLK